MYVTFGKLTQNCKKRHLKNEVCIKINLNSFEQTIAFRKLDLQINIYFASLFMHIFKWVSV